MSGFPRTADHTEAHTHFAPSERESASELRREREVLERNPLVEVLLNAGAGYLLILNSRRQIVVAGNNLPKPVTLESIEDMLGLRPGEALQCSHAGTGPGGCGTGMHCRECGAVQAIQEALHRRSRAAVTECSLLVGQPHDLEALEFKVEASYFEVEGISFILCALTDISHEKRRKNLERVFFHDVLNLAGGVEGLLELLHLGVQEADRQILQMATATMQDLREEIVVQRDLLAAEQNELRVTHTRVRSIELVNQLLQTYQAHPVCQNRVLRLSPLASEFDFRTDTVLLRRVLGNLIKNAAEATVVGGPVVISCMSDGQKAFFAVYNSAVMKQATSLKVFQRSFSTKGEGRGLGTYSVKLLTERYLQGRVSFISREPDGTCFTVELPLNM